MAKNQPDTTLRRAFKYLLEKEKVSQQRDIVTIAGVNEGQVSTYMNHNVKISEDFAKKFSSAFGLNLADFEDGALTDKGTLRTGNVKNTLTKKEGQGAEAEGATPDRWNELFDNISSLSKALVIQAEANRLQGEANKLQGEASVKAQDNHAELIQVLGRLTANSPVETESMSIAKFAELMEVVSEIGVGKMWPSKQEGSDILRRRVYGKMMEAKSEGIFERAGSADR